MANPALLMRPYDTAATAEPSGTDYANYPEGYKAKFVLYNDKYPQVYPGIVRRARELKARGFTNIGCVIAWKT